MIKLFWNTHNQSKSDSSDEKIKKKEDQDYAWGLYHRKNSDKWIYELLKKTDFKIINEPGEVSWIILYDENFMNI